MAALRMVTYEEIEAANVREARELSGLSGRELARRVGVHQNLVSRIENGRVQEVARDLIMAMADAMAGEGRFKDHDATVVLGVMRGEVSFHPRLSSDPDDVAMGRYLRPEADLTALGLAS